MPRGGASTATTIGGGNCAMSRSTTGCWTLPLPCPGCGSSSSVTWRAISWTPWGWGSVYRSGWESGWVMLSRPTG